VATPMLVEVVLYTSFLTALFTFTNLKQIGCTSLFYPCQFHEIINMTKLQSLYW
jgi:hypothetical protein